MCFICKDLENNIINEYDAIILLIELAGFIGLTHSKNAIEAIKKPKVLDFFNDDDYNDDSFYPNIGIFD